MNAPGQVRSSQLNSDGLPIHLLCWSLNADRSIFIVPGVGGVFRVWSRWAAHIALIRAPRAATCSPRAMLCPSGCFNPRARGGAPEMRRLSERARQNQVLVPFALQDIFLAPAEFPASDNGLYSCESR